MVGGVERSCSKNLERRPFFAIRPRARPKFGRSRQRLSILDHQARHFGNAWTRRRTVRIRVRHRTRCSALLIVLASPLSIVQRELIIDACVLSTDCLQSMVALLRMRRRIDARMVQIRRAISDHAGVMVARILQGVEALPTRRSRRPTKYQFVDRISKRLRRSASTCRRSCSPRADEVIECMLFCCGALVRNWHQATDCRESPIRSPSEARRTCRESSGSI